MRMRDWTGRDKIENENDIDNESERAVVGAMRHCYYKLGIQLQPISLMSH
jgi:hypothetical protein